MRYDEGKQDAGSSSSHGSFRQVVMDLLASRDRTFDDIQVRANNNNENNNENNSFQTILFTDYDSTCSNILTGLGLGLG